VAALLKLVVGSRSVRQFTIEGLAILETTAQKLRL